MDTFVLVRVQGVATRTHTEILFLLRVSTLAHRGRGASRPDRVKRYTSSIVRFIYTCHTLVSYILGLWNGI